MAAKCDAMPLLLINIIAFISFSRLWAVGINNYSQLQILISQAKHVERFFYFPLLNQHHYSLRFEIRK